MNSFNEKEWSQIADLIDILKKSEQQGLNIKTIFQMSEEGKISYEFTNEQKAILKKLEFTTYYKIQTQKTAADKLLDIIDVLENNIPGISGRLPKAAFRLGDFDEIKNVLEKERLPANYKMNISLLVTKAKKQSIGKPIDRCISVENILKLKKYGLLTDEQIADFKKREDAKVNGKPKTKAKELIEILKILQENGVDVSSLPKFRKKIGDIDEIRDIAENQNIDLKYDIGSNIQRILMGCKRELSGEKNNLVIEEDDIDTLKEMRLLTDKMIEIYQRKSTSASKAINFAKKLRDNGVDVKKLVKYEGKIGDLKGVNGLEKLLNEEGISKKYKLGKILQSAVYSAKLSILLSKNPGDEYLNRKRKTAIKITEQDIETFKEWGVITEESIKKFEEAQNRNRLKSIATQAIEMVKQGKDSRVEKMLRQAVLKHVQDNPEVRRQLEELLLEHEHANERDEI